MPLSGKQLVRLLQENGWILVRINGSHQILVKGQVTVTVPVHANRSLGKGLESKILNRAGLKKP